MRMRSKDVVTPNYAGGDAGALAPNATKSEQGLDCTKADLKAREKYR